MSSEFEVEDELKTSTSGDEDSDYEDRPDSEDEREYSDETDNKDESDLDDGRVKPKEEIEVETLEQLCLKNIVKNFDRFNTAYRTSEDATLQRNLEFLQRAYSQHMITHRRGKIDDSCLDFLLNEHLKEVDLELLDKCSELAIIKRLSQIGHSIVKGNLTPMPSPAFGFFDESHLKLIVKLITNVQVLHVDSVCNNDILQAIASSCPKLQELYVRDSSVTDEGVKYLFKESNGEFQAVIPLKIMSLMNTKVEAHGLSFLLRNMPSLQILSHNLVPLVLHSLHKEDAQKDSIQKYNLTTLDLMKFNYVHDIRIDLSEALASCAAVCPYVTKLSSIIRVDEQLKKIPLFTQLEDLTLDYLDDFGVVDNPLCIDSILQCHGRNLKTLNLGCFSLSVPVLLQGCPRLEKLSLRDVVFEWKEKTGTSDLPCLNNLRKLYLEHFIFGENPVEEMSVEAILNSSPNLELLDIAHSEVANTNIQTTLNNFCAKSSLQSLHFICSDVNAVMLEYILLTCSSLRTLTINDCTNVLEDHVNNFYHIISSKKQKVDIIWNDHRSELNSIADDFFDPYDFSDYDYDYDYDDFGPDDDFEDYDLDYHDHILDHM